MTAATGPDHVDIVALLAACGGRPPEAVGEQIDSMDLARLLYALEQRYWVSFDLDDTALGRMSTVTGAQAVVREVLARRPHHA